MKAYFKLFKQFILRALWREKMRSVITALGISLGVGVMIAIRLANAGALESFRAATSSVAGETSIQIVGAAGRFDEMLLADLGWLRDYGQVSPVISGYAMADLSSKPSAADAKTQDSDSQNKPGEPVPQPDPITVPPEAGEFLQVLGVDVLRDRALRNYRLLRLNDT